PARARTRRDRAWLRFGSGAGVGSLSARVWGSSCRARRLVRDRRALPAAGRSGDERRVLLRRARRRLLARFRQLHGPRPLLAGIDFEETGALESAGEAVLDAANREFLVTGAHIGTPRPFTAAVIIDRIDIVE